jgi:hypothetical protein
VTARRALSIGITIGLGSPDESLWTNGIKQNALFLAKLFQHSTLGHRVTLLNTTDVVIGDRLPWSLETFPTMAMGQGEHDFDIVFELGGQISMGQTDALKRRGARIVSYCCGPEYVQTMEAMIFRRHMYDHIYINPRYDEIWVIPQVTETSFYFFQTLRRRPTRRVPFVWDPMCLEAASAGLPDGGEYRPRTTAKRLSVIEPNIDVMKFCLYPLLLAERAFREAPDKIGFLHVTNADQLVWDDKEFASVARTLDIVNAHKASFVGRFQTPQFLSEHTDIVISHQWGLALNYLYLEVCWQGYPLIHNAHLVSELGYYYPDNNIEAGAQQLLRAIDRHDDAWEDWRDEQRRLIGRFLADDPALALAYDDLMFDLLDQPPAP